MTANRAAVASCDQRKHQSAASHRAPGEHVAPVVVLGLAPVVAQRPAHGLGRRACTRAQGFRPSVRPCSAGRRGASLRPGAPTWCRARRWVVAPELAVAKAPAQDRVADACERTRCVGCLRCTCAALNASPLRLQPTAPNQRARAPKQRDSVKSLLLWSKSLPSSSMCPTCGWVRGAAQHGAWHNGSTACGLLSPRRSTTHLRHVSAHAKAHRRTGGSVCLRRKVVVHGLSSGWLQSGPCHPEEQEAHSGVVQRSCYQWRAVAARHLLGHAEQAPPVGRTGRALALSVVVVAVAHLAAHAVHWVAGARPVATWWVGQGMQVPLLPQRGPAP